MKAVFVVALAVMATVAPSLGADHLRERRTDDVSLSTLQHLLEQQASAIQTLESELASTKNTLSDTVSKLNAAQDRLQDVESRQAAAVGFTVRFTKDNVDLGPAGTLKFDHFMSSLGGGYDSHTGIFTAPVSGLYAFYLTIMSANGHWIQVSLVKEGVSVDTAHAGASDGHSMYDQGTLLATLHLKQGEQVWNQRENGDSTILRGVWWTVFSGYLLHAD